MWLVVETSGAICSAGIYDPATKHWLAYSRIDNADHSAVLPPMVNELFDISGVGREEISSLATNLGPGSFTGLRIGLSFLKGFHAVFKPTFLATTTFKMLYYSLPEEERHGTIHTVVPMHRKKIYLQTFINGENLEPVTLEVHEAIRLFEKTKGKIISSEKTEWLQKLRETTVVFQNSEANLITQVPELEVMDTSEILSLEPRYVADFTPHSKHH
ncbi:MAG: tRNA (adenosine(37)-N6)-threonylcarbamoyltransferase complex dimerization subunit type 1 TsaB [Chlorobi bacterium]|nr:tRNA (adenosine(37)-N6)-threonylcarbamoyltransferase complex dimerization subunit type 1 TsaB [Chlorobiota bacterium]